MKKIYILTHFSSDFTGKGNNRFNYLARLLANIGYDVEFVTSDFSHVKKQKRSVNNDELQFKVTMLSEPGYKKNVCVKRFYSHYVFGRNLKKHLERKEKPDLVYVAVPSLDVGSVAADYCKKNGIPYIVDIQDLWPEAFKLVLNIPVVSDVIFFPLTLQANKTYGQADKIIAVSETYKNRGLESCKKDKEGLCVYLGTDLGTFDKAANASNVEKPENELWVTYVGTLGHSYNIEIIIDALSRLDEKVREGVVFKVLGDGPYMQRFMDFAKDKNVRVDFLGRRDYPEMVGYLAKSDIAVNPIVKGAAQSIINKHGDYAAAGLPVVNTQECPEYRNLMTEYDCGINCDVESTEQVADALQMLITDADKRKQMGENSRRMAEERFDRKNTYEYLINEIKKCLGE